MEEKEENDGVVRKGPSEGHRSRELKWGEEASRGNIWGNGDACARQVWETARTCVWLELGAEDEGQREMRLGGDRGSTAVPCGHNDSDFLNCFLSVNKSHWRAWGGFYLLFPHYLLNPTTRQVLCWAVTTVNKAPFIYFSKLTVWGGRCAMKEIITIKCLGSPMRKENLVDII